MGLAGWLRDSRFWFRCWAFGLRWDADFFPCNFALGCFPSEVFCAVTKGGFEVCIAGMERARRALRPLISFARKPQARIWRFVERNEGGCGLGIRNSDSSGRGITAFRRLANQRMAGISGWRGICLFGVNVVRNLRLASPRLRHSPPNRRTAVKFPNP